MDDRQERQDTPDFTGAMQVIGAALYKMVETFAYVITEPFIQLAKLWPDPVPPELPPSKPPATMPPRGPRRV
jgi:hypothetical protein